VPTRNATPVEFTPVGLSDAVDEASAFAGACTSISNFVFDRVSRGAVVPRPGVQAVAFDPTNYPTPGRIAVAFMTGNLIYGLVGVGSGSLAGHDVPFAFNVATGAFVTVSGATTSNTPLTQPDTGDWTPPTTDMVGIYIVVTHPGFSGGSNPFFGWFNLTTPATPAWSAGNTATNPLSSVPEVVAQYFDRAYFFCGNAAISTDILNPLNVTTAEEADALFIGDPTVVTGACGLPIGTATQGVLAALLVFKSKSIWQITGDVALSNLALNQVTNSVGTTAGRSLAPTPAGVGFMASDGIRQVNLLGETPYMNTDVFAPFSQVVSPSRTAACYANSVYRISVNTSFKQSMVTFNDYWFDNLAQRWNGPHTFPFNVVVTDGTAMYGGADAFPGFLFTSQIAPQPSSLYTDNGAAYNCAWASCNIDRPNPNVVKQMVESTLELSASSVDSTYTVQLTNQLESVLNSVSVKVQNPGAVWGAFNWGAANWRQQIVTSSRYGLPWTQPIVFEKLQVSVSVLAAASVATKRFMMNTQPTNHMTLSQ
jgi:hypothetical protein